MDIRSEESGTLRAKGGQPPLVYDYVSDLPDVHKAHVGRSLFENHGQDCRYKGPLEESPTLSSTLGTGGNNQPLVAYDIRQTSENTKNERHNIYACDVSRTIDTSGNPPTRNQGGVAIIYSMSKNSHFTSAALNETSSLVATDYKDPPVVFNKYVRRLTPTECGRLQGFPDAWCKNLGTDNPTKEEMDFWRQVFQTDADIRGLKKRKTDRQILKWFKNPHTDLAEYKMWGNGVALPCLIYIFKRLVNSVNIA
ncbi:DNA cytosine methyltransferase [Facklamia sp. P12950]|uniref:DNA cytosine methyltransferase n=1 Tax=Facklamia sp. P12950 TaxID=3421951 RepID=UPI003D16CAC6